MEKTAKILLIACIILIAMLSLTIGILIGNQQNTHSALNATNNTNLSANTVNDTTTTKTKLDTTKNTKSKQNTGLISPSQAMAIANSYASQNGAEAAGLDYVALIHVKDHYGNFYYRVDLKWKSGCSKSYDPGYVMIDAKTGSTDPWG